MEVERNHAGDAVHNRWSVEQPTRERARDRDHVEDGDRTESVFILADRTPGFQATN